MSRAARRDGQPVRARPGDVRAALHPHRRPDLHRDQLLHRHHHRAPPRPRRRAARVVRVVRPDGLRGRPVDVLQAARRRHGGRCTGSTSTRSSRTARCPTRSRSSSRLGRTMTIELDAWYLPDTAATSYGNAHVKTGGDRRGDRRRRRAASATSTTPRCTSCPARTSGAPSGPAPGWSRRRPPAVHRAGPLRRRARASSGEALRAASRELAAAATCARSCPATRSTASRARLDRRPAGLLEGDATATTPITFATFRMAGAGFELLAVPRRLAARRRRRAGVGGDAPDRRGLQGARLQAGPPPAVRSDRRDGRPRRGLAEAIDALDGAVG